jgi:hypothetical protein
MDLLHEDLLIDTAGSALDMFIILGHDTDSDDGPYISHALADDVLHNIPTTISDPPAIIWTDNSKKWFVNDELYRAHGRPATITYGRDGRKEWYKDGKLHRIHHSGEHRPAVVYNNGKMIWYMNGVRHRLNGPAVIYPDGGKEWYQNGFIV